MTSRENDLLPSSLFPIQYFKNESCSSAFRPALSNLWLLLVLILIKIQSKTTNLSTRLWGINTEFPGSRVLLRLNLNISKLIGLVNHSIRGDNNKLRLLPCFIFFTLYLTISIFFTSCSTITAISIFSL